MENDEIKGNNYLKMTESTNAKYSSISIYLHALYYEIIIADVFFNSMSSSHLATPFNNITLNIWPAFHYSKRNSKH